MSIVILLIGIILMSLGIYVADRESTEGMFAVGTVVVMLGLLMIASNSVDVVKGRTYDKKIEMYQEENKKIENQIDLIVRKYMTHEDETLKKAKYESSMTLVSLYPELKSDSLVKEQIKIYNKNNSKIKELKESQIDVTTAKWWLYFGG
ncbi:hypothetical protein [Enterococcus thailandicus]|uniref:Uncharacterized protein n=1 Tax=Enterococcus thailandicus TaxID=417368 RepID=A0A179EV21_ENTTH|nr:hypothetical protein [Enterococcus thailandicus]OAQ57066.1 hypothetical protein A6E74_01435 [Enterococcus thailandicus]